MHPVRVALALATALTLFVSPATSQEVVFLVRHAEQALEGDDPGLTSRGRARVEALAELLADAGIDAILASDARRTVETAAAVARRLGLEPVLLPGRDVAAFVTRTRAADASDRILVVGHSNTVPEILAGLGVPDPPAIDHADYGTLFVLTPGEGGDSRLLRLRYGAPAGVYAATLAEPDPVTPEVSTAELIAILEQDAALLLDTRPHMEWATSHIPGALNVAPKPGQPMSLYTSDVAEIERLTHGERTRPVVLYCNGPFCGKSKRVSADLLAAGFTDVRRYQLGAPVWRALGGVMAIEPDGVAYVRARDGTAVFVDARDRAAHEADPLPATRNVPPGEAGAAKDDGRLPMEDHNTRIVVFGDTAGRARAVAEEIARNAFHNVAYFDGDLAAFSRAIE